MLYKRSLGCTWQARRLTPQEHRPPEGHATHEFASSFGLLDNPRNLVPPEGSALEAPAGSREGPSPLLLEYSLHVDHPCCLIANRRLKHGGVYDVAAFT